MPELPEVETVRVQLWSKLRGRTIVKVEVFHPKTIESSTSFKNKLKGLTLNNIDRVGKLLIFSFKQKPLYLLGHLKMTGQFFLVDKKGNLVGGGHSINATDTSSFPGRHTRVAFHLDNDSKLYFNDMRLFGYLRTTDEAGLSKARTHFGPEPISENFDPKEFAQGLKSKKTTIKATLLDQTFVAGLGNIYVDEVLFFAGVKPNRVTNKVTQKEALKIAEGATKILQAAIKSGGTTFQHFIDSDGKKGNYTESLQVFGRQGQSCYRCGSTIKKIRVAGRGTHYCPKCQK